MEWGRRKDNDQAYIKKPKKNLNRITGSVKPSTGKTRLATKSYFSNNSKINQQLYLENLNLIKNKDVRENIQENVESLWKHFVFNGMEGGMIWSFLKDAINGQILISLGKNDKSHYVNKLHDFYIDDRVGFKNRKRVMELVNEIEQDLLKIVRYEPPKIKTGDIVKPNSLYPNNVVLRDLIKENPNITFKVMEMNRGLDPSYIGYQLVPTDKKEFKNNYIYAGSDDLERIDK